MQSNFTSIGAIEPNAVYHASEPVSKSDLARIARSPAWFKYCQDNPPKQTDSMLFGSAFHKFVLEPDDFDKEFVVAPIIDKRTKAGKEQYAEFIEANPGKSIIGADDFEIIKGMRESIVANKYAKALIQGVTERSFYWTDAITGEKCKCRPDVIRKIGMRNVVVDLKSCESAATDDFQRDAINCSYDLQAYMYTEGLRNITGEEHDFIFVAVEKKPPYLLNILQADEFILKRGEALFREYLGIYHECKQTGNWYGYNGFSGAINTLTLPAWLLKEFED
jgi:hypothetical protein